MEKIAAVLLALTLLMSIENVGGEKVAINSSISNPVIQVENLSAHTEANVSKSIISAQLNISNEPQTKITAYMQKPQETISVGANISTGGVNIIPVLGNKTSLSQSVDLNLETGSKVIIENQSLKIVQVSALNKTYEIKNVNLTNANQPLKINSQVFLNRTNSHNIFVSIENGTRKLILNSSGVIVKTNLTLELDSAGVYVSIGNIKTELKNLPDTVAVITKNSSNKNIELKIVQQEPVYEIKETKQGKILGIFPASMDVVTQVSANNSQTKTIKEPWWSVFFVQ